MCSDSEKKALHVFTWTIENFRACSQRNCFYFSSPEFVAESLDRTTWHVELYPNGAGASCEEFISCFLERANNCAGPDEIECEYTLEAIDKNNKSLAKYQFLKNFKKGNSFGVGKFISRDSNLNRCSNDTLTVKVSLKKKSPNFFSVNSGCTKIVTDHYSYKWNVKNSTSFTTDIKPVLFTDTLSFDITIEIPEDDVYISLRRKMGFTGSEILICTVTLIHLKGQRGESKEAIFESYNPNEKDIWKFPNFLKRSKINAEKDKYIAGDYFTLQFDFEYSNGQQCESTKNNESTVIRSLGKTKEDYTTSFRKNLKSMFNNNVHTDVELRAGGGDEIVRAHKLILCAASPVFSAMFNQDMAEKQTGAILIDDVEAGTLTSLLEFMYIGDTEILDYESALKLLLAADKYQVLALKEQCSSSLESFMSDENVCDILFTADLVQQSSLKVCAVNHIKEHSKMIFKSDEWKQLAERSLKLATETFCEVSTLSG